MYRIIPRILLCLFVTGLLTSCYVIQQAGPFLSHHLCARPIDKLLADNRTDPATVTFLDRVEDIRNFARTELGLEESDNYTKFYPLDRDYLAAVVQAAPEFSVEPYMFRYPVFGKLPYRGFYSLKLAKREAEKLTKQGLDVFIRPVDAFSSLGFFSDPLFSFMIDYSASRLADLIIHEETHATLFIKGESDFNEKLATFVGREGAREYVISRFGESSDEYADMTTSGHDSEQYTRDLFELAQSLTEVYALDISPEEKRAMKADTIEQFRHEFAENYDERYEEEGYRDAADMDINNAYLSLFRIYEEQDGRLQRLFVQSGGIQEMMSRLKAGLEASGAKPWDVVDELLGN